MSKSRVHTAALEVPAWLEACIERSLGFPLVKRTRVESFAPALRELAGRFLDEQRDIFDDERHYYEDERLRQAYLLYYTTSNFLKLLHPFNELFRSAHFRGLREVRVLELGCGTGTGILGMQAWRESRPDAPRIHCTATDAFQGSLRFIETLLPALPDRQGLTVQTRHCDLDHPASLSTLRERYDVVLMMNALNELRPATVAALPALLTDMLQPEGMALVVEPALRHTSRALLHLRDAMTREGWTAYAPCHRQGDCPALHTEKDWCHHEEFWNRPAFIQWLDAMLHNVKLSLKYGYIIMNRSGDTLDRTTTMPGRCGRVVSALFEEKGRTRAYVCDHEGRRQFLKNHRDNSDANAAFDTLNRFDTVAITGAETRHNDMRITPATMVVKL